MDALRAERKNLEIELARLHHSIKDAEIGQTLFEQEKEALQAKIEQLQELIETQRSILESRQDQRATIESEKAALLSQIQKSTEKLKELKEASVRSAEEVKAAVKERDQLKQILADKTFVSPVPTTTSAQESSSSASVARTAVDPFALLSAPAVAASSAITVASTPTVPVPSPPTMTSTPAPGTLTSSVHVTSTPASTRGVTESKPSSGTVLDEEFPDFNDAGFDTPDIFSVSARPVAVEPSKKVETAAAVAPSASTTTSKPTATEAFDSKFEMDDNPFDDKWLQDEISSGPNPFDFLNTSKASAAPTSAPGQKPFLPTPPVAIAAPKSYGGSTTSATITSDAKATSPVKPSSPAIDDATAFDVNFDDFDLSSPFDAASAAVPSKTVAPVAPSSTSSSKAGASTTSPAPAPAASASAQPARKPTMDDFSSAPASSEFGKFDNAEFPTDDAWTF